MTGVVQISKHLRSSHVFAVINANLQRNTFELWSTAAAAQPQ